MLFFANKISNIVIYLLNVFFPFFLIERRCSLKERKSAVFKKRVKNWFTWLDFGFKFQAFVMLEISNKVCMDCRLYFTVFSFFVDYQNVFHTFSALFFGLLFSNNIRLTNN